MRYLAAVFAHASRAIRRAMRRMARLGHAAVRLPGALLASLRGGGGGPVETIGADAADVQEEILEEVAAAPAADVVPEMSPYILETLDRSRMTPGMYRAAAITDACTAHERGEPIPAYVREALPQMAWDWVTALNAAEATRVKAAGGRLPGHLAGVTPLPGVLPYDQTWIDRRLGRMPARPVERRRTAAAGRIVAPILVDGLDDEAEAEVAYARP